jgi:geranylgeranyl diphosphate synthase type II
MAFSEKDAAQLQHLFTMQLEDNVTKIESVKDIFNNSGASKANQDAIQEYTFATFETLENEYRRGKKGYIKSFW